MERNKVQPMTDHSHTGALQNARIPAPHEGIGRALRGLYIDPKQSLPSDLERLLDKLR
ncbi:MAG: hypothetical protein JWL91_1464, partial [Sphingomonas bacterium]|jgi:hypothetical protein|nr:hypothetical protein [Sphingomonas bacterium]